MKRMRLLAVMVVIVIAMGVTAYGDLVLPYYGKVYAPEKAFWVSNTYSGSGMTFGGFFYTAGIEGRGVLGQSNGSLGTGVRGYASDDSLDAKNYGGYFTADGGLGVGVRGRASSSGNVLNYGGMFYAEGLYGIGVYARGGPQGSAAEFAGDVVITGDGHGIVFPDGTVQTTAATCDDCDDDDSGCSAPAYDSGWVVMSLPGQRVELLHEVGGNLDDYVVDLELKRNNIAGDVYLTNAGYGSAVYYDMLTTDSMVVKGPDLVGIDYSAWIRVRIWLCGSESSEKPDDGGKPL